MDNRSHLLYTGGDLEAGFSGGGAVPPFDLRRRGSFRSIPRSVPPPPPPAVAGFFCDDFSDNEPGHFLDACFLCKKSLANGDIFMYRGDMPFCSEECRQEQIEIDEAKERSKASASPSPAQRQVSARQQQSHVRAAAGTVVAG